MQNQLYINDKNAWSNWCMKLDEGYDALIIPANPKDYTSNDLRSHPGIQTFVSNTQPQAKEFQLIFALTCNSTEDYQSKLESFTNELNGVIKFYVPVLKTVYRLRVVEYLNLTSGLGLKDGRISIRFSEDNPKNRERL